MGGFLGSDFLKQKLQSYVELPWKQALGCLAQEGSGNPSSPYYAKVFQSDAITMTEYVKRKKYLSPLSFAEIQDYDPVAAGQIKVAAGG